MLTIIGCGNLNRSDDGVGVLVAQRLAAELAPELADRVQVHDAGTGGMGVMYQARGADSLIVVDARRGGGEPGSIYEVPSDELAGIPEPSINLRDFRWNNALFVGRKLFGTDFPTDVTVYLIEAGSLEQGPELSPVVEESLGRVIDAIRARIDLYVATPPPARA